MTSSSATDHVNPAGISALMQESTSKGMEANKNFGKWLSCGIQISGTFGLHYVQGSIPDVNIPILSVVNDNLSTRATFMAYYYSIFALNPGDINPSKMDLAASIRGYRSIQQITRAF
jgi:hypothetical protein